MKKSFVPKKKNITYIACQHGKIFRRFKAKDKFVMMVKEFKVNKRTIIFKLNILKLINKYPRLMTSLMTLGFLKTDFMGIKEIYNKNSNEFKLEKITCLRSNS